MEKRIDLIKQWLHKTEDAENRIWLQEGVAFCCPVPKAARGRIPYGFDTINDSAVNVMGWYGFFLSCQTEKENVELTFSVKFYNGQVMEKKVSFAEPGEHKFTIRLEDFLYPSGMSNRWRELTEVTISGEAFLTQVLLLKGKKLCVKSEVLGKAACTGEEITYEVMVGNCTLEKQLVEISQKFYGWESMEAQILPKSFVLQPEEEKTITVKVMLNDRFVPGGHEDTTLCFIPDGDGSAAESITFSSLCKLAQPFIYHTKEGWAKVAENIATKEVFHPEYERLKAKADSWNVPGQLPLEEKNYCFDTFQEEYIMSAAYLYSITGELEYAKKIARFFRNFINEEDGYPVKKRGCSQSYVQEGHFFQHLALAYDMIREAGVLTEEEHNGIEKCFRLYMEILDWHVCGGHISNWILSELTGAVYCAMALQDYERMNRFVFGTGGSLEQLRYGAFNDGWWYECSVGYNIWVSSMCLHTAHALLNFGINILHTQFPATYNKEVSASLPMEKVKINFGMYGEKWGGNRKNYVCIKDLFDAAVPFLDYRGVLFGMNDSDEKKIEGAHFGSTYDLAYTYYKDPAYIPIIRRADTVDPIFGHAELPKVSEMAGKENAYADNIGMAVLRSQTPGRPQREQIQAVLRYGSHGYAHGHFDRTELLSLMRYGKSFFNPECCWWGYPHFMYKFYVQNSNTKNMVVVDEKMQVPADAKRIMFYSGKKMQAVAVTTTTKWSYPPFGGMIYDNGDSLKERCERNSCDLDDYEAAPYGELTEFTEDIIQTRAMAVFDDYVVLFDCLTGEKEHSYESLFQIKGYLGLKAVDNGVAGKTEEKNKITYLKHTGQKTKEVRSDAQFITDCHWYEVEGTSVASFQTVFGPGEDMRGNRSQHNEPGNLYLDVYTAWPKKTTQMHGLVAEDHKIYIPYAYEIIVDGECVVKDKANAWILGTKKFNVSFRSSNMVEIKINNGPIYNEQQYPRKSKQGLFLAGTYVILEDGTKLSVAECVLLYRNIDMGHGIGKDYEGGRVLIKGEEYKDAVPVSPVDHEQPGSVFIQVPGHKIAGISGVLGADAFPGDEAQRRRTYAVGQRAMVGRFITVIEPFEEKKQVTSVLAEDENTVCVRLKDGRCQKIYVSGMEQNQISITLQEWEQPEKILYEESSTIHNMVR